MPSAHPEEQRKVTKQNPSGSSSEEIANEPDWARAGHEHYAGYKNRSGRRPGLVGRGDDEDEDEVDVQASQDKLKKTQRAEREGHLVNWQDAIRSEKDLSLYHPEGHPNGWRFVLDYTEDGIENQQKWPANLRKWEKQRQQQEEEEKKKEEEEQQRQRQQGQKTQADGKSDQQASQQNGESGQDSGSASSNNSDSNGNSDSFSNSDSNSNSDSDSEGQQDNRSEDEKLRDKYTPQQIALLRAVQHEKEYMANLETNDGTGHSHVCNRTTISIDEADQFTPDNWVPRSADLIRLTGKHPLNAEAPLRELFEAGMITPNELFYVRSHGAVPHLLWEYHKLEVSYRGRSKRFSMDQIKSNFDSINIPVFLGCQGGRRKEMNMYKRTKGFGFGPGAIGCAYWKGPLLRDVLMSSGVPAHMPDENRKKYYVHLQGADDPGQATYETSIPFEYVMDRTNDVILAYEMNDVPLPPDHGYPIRIIIPGYIGGRQVKWLQKVWVSDKENDSYYHIWDNRLVPSFVTTNDDELAEAMFHHPDTALYEQCLNSVITVPHQGDKIPLKNIRKGVMYRIKGLAFNGRGDEIKRVEVTLDDGKSWYYCIRKFPPAPVRHGKKYWAWCFWHVDVDIGDVISAPSIRVRAWDVKMLTQPEQPTWNLLGSLNNAQYTVKHEMVNDDTPHILFRHPVEPGNGDGGWMKDSAENQIAQAAMKTDAPNKQFTREEIEKHDKEDDCWIVIDNKVFDATSVMSWHPGGKAPIMMHAGAVHYDTTDEFSSVHDDYAYQKLDECVLGVVTDKTKSYIERTRQEKAKSGTEVPADQALQKHRWVPAKLTERNWVSHDTAVYKFALPANADYLGLGTCQHIEFGFHLRDRLLIRQYTPTKPVLPRDSGIDAGDDAELHDGSGSFQLVVKTYFPDDDQPGGALSNILAAIPIGEHVEMRGPTGEIVYYGAGKFDLVGQERTFKRISLVLGGTGLTPGYSLIARISLDAKDTTEIRVIDANKTEEDILLREDLSRFEKQSNRRLRITHVLSHPSDKWKGLKGHVTKETMQNHLFPPDEDSLVLLCGPPSMIQKAALPALKEWGYDQDKNMFGL